MHESIRLAAFFGVFLFMAAWELAAPRRPLTTAKGWRWFANIGIVVIDTLIVRFAFPATATGTALFAESSASGLFNIIQLPYALTILLSIVLLDLVVYIQHVGFHLVPMLWRLHKVHHADRDLDVSSGLRFHPLEIIISLGIKVAAILLLGTPVVAVVLFEVILNATAMFNHSNVRLPLALDRVLRWVLVTPDMHRVHHSVDGREYNTNYGFNLPWWDRIFRTYCAQPAKGHDAMTIGLADYQDRPLESLGWMLLLPFRRVPKSSSER
jgi:sterol desaturase/sphingolipid hydroxylase (fatty acid hydroxylase superfamily)